MSEEVTDEQASVADEAEAPEELDFGAWVHATLSLIEAPASQGKSFCPQWWLHPEAVARFKALYVQYLKARDDDEISGWWVYHWDAHARALMDPATGVFRDCAGGHLEGLDSRVREVIADEVSDPGFIDLDDSDPYWI